jgi:DnaJ-class molecular chaperone
MYWTFFKKKKMKYDCPYKILGVPKNITTDRQSRIKSAWRKLSELYHPDTGKNGGDPDKFIQIQWAYKFLIDRKKREEYNKTGVINQDDSSINEAARENIVILFKNVIHGDETFYHNFKRMDLFEVMRIKIRTKIQEAKTELIAYRTLIKNLHDIAMRIETPVNNSEFFISQIMANEISSTEKLLLKKKTEIKTFDLMLKMLENYNYNTDS